MIRRQMSHEYAIDDDNSGIEISVKCQVVCQSGCDNWRQLLYPTQGLSTFRAPFPPTTNCAGVLGELGPHPVDPEEISKTFWAYSDTSLWSCCKEISIYMINPFSLFLSSPLLISTLLSSHQKYEDCQFQLGFSTAGKIASSTYLLLSVYHHKRLKCVF